MHIGVDQALPLAFVDGKCTHAAGHTLSPLRITASGMTCEAASNASGVMLQVHLFGTYRETSRIAGHPAISRRKLAIA